MSSRGLAVERSLYAWKVSGSIRDKSDLYFFSRFVFFLLFYQLLVQYSLLFDFADWQCVVLIICVA